MELAIDQDLMAICQEIITDNHSEDEWAEMESGDMFQRGRYSGGFDSDDMFFAFSYDEDGSEWCLSLTLQEVQQVVSGEKATVQVDKWEDLMAALEESGEV